MPAQRHEKLTKYRVSEYQVKSGKEKGHGRGINGDSVTETSAQQRRLAGQPLAPTSRSHTRDRYNLRENAIAVKGPRTNAASANKGHRKPKKTKEYPMFIIPDDDWQLWAPVFLAGQRETKLTTPLTKHKLETTLSKDGHRDVYNQKHCIIGGPEDMHVIFTTDPSDQTVTLLACRLKDGPSGMKERVATRTSIGHHVQTGHSPWSVLEQCPEIDATVGLARDMPEDDDISFYEYPLRIAKQRREIAGLRSKLGKALEREETKDAKIGERNGEIGRLNELLERARDGSAGASEEMVKGLEDKVRGLLEASLAMENQKRAL